MADPFNLTDKPVRMTAPGKQDLRLVFDGGPYDECDLLLTVYEASVNVTIEILTSMQNESEQGWVSAGTFSSTGANTALKLNIKNFLRYLRWNLQTSATTTFLIQGMGRRWG